MCLAIRSQCPAGLLECALCRLKNPWRPSPPVSQSECLCKVLAPQSVTTQAACKKHRRREDRKRPNLDRHTGQCGQHCKGTGTSCAGNCKEQAGEPRAHALSTRQDPMQNRMPSPTAYHLVATHAKCLGFKEIPSRLEAIAKRKGRNGSEFISHPRLENWSWVREHTQAMPQKQNVSSTRPTVTMQNAMGIRPSQPLACVKATLNTYWIPGPRRLNQC